SPRSLPYLQPFPTRRSSDLIGLAYGLTKHSTFEELSARPAIHDLDDPASGYIPGSQLEMFHLRLRYDNDRRTAYVQDFTLIDIRSEEHTSELQSRVDLVCRL